ncbi:MAG: hypothetical protein QOG21_1239 [Actinomycetota bacterium]|nr:hypothetical protein [Actinomycetota bacterium]
MLIQLAKWTAEDESTGGTNRQRGINMKLKAFRIAATISTLAMAIAASGAGQKWAH